MLQAEMLLTPSLLLILRPVLQRQDMNKLKVKLHTDNGLLEEIILTGLKHLNQMLQLIQFQQRLKLQLLMLLKPQLPLQLMPRPQLLPQLMQKLQLPRKEMLRPLQPMLKPQLPKKVMPRPPQLKNLLQSKRTPRQSLMPQKRKSQRSKTHKIPMILKLIPLKKFLELPPNKEHSKPNPMPMLLPLKLNSLTPLKILRIT